jgi:hypothetical protein
MGFSFDFDFAFSNGHWQKNVLQPGYGPGLSLSLLNVCELTPFKRASIEIVWRNEVKASNIHEPNSAWFISATDGDEDTFRSFFKSVKDHVLAKKKLITQKR